MTSTELVLASGAVTVVDTTAKHNLGIETRDTSGNVFVYLKGVASTAAGSWVTYDENGETTLLAANAVGPVAIAMAATVASTYGWYQVVGKNVVAKTDTVAADKPLYIDGTAGRVDDAAVAGDLVFNAVSRTADTANVATVQINRPFVCDGAYLV